uniref:CSON000365 protein n=1 Tax=Culicoides sonorensis TaxID=179676 RepID=A0A336MEU7_CULSO
MNVLKLLQNGLKQRKVYSTIYQISHLSKISRSYCTTKVVESDPDRPIAMENPFQKEKKVCILCKLNIDPDYKNVRLLSQFQSPYTGRIYGKHITGLCKKRQEQVESAITMAINSGLMPGYHKKVEFIKDPKLFNPERPVKPHKY